MSASNNTTKNACYNPYSYYNVDKETLKVYESLWKLNNLELLDDTPYSYVLKGTSNLYGQIILKKRSEVKIVEDEYHTLLEYKGNHFCIAYDVDLETGVLLEEQIVPGTVLKDLESLDKRLEIFCDLFLGLHKPYTGNYAFSTYLDWVSRISEYMANLEEFKELASHMRKAELICKELFAQYPPNMLLHGDLHHYNILLNSTGSYTVIDPKGILGHPIFDIPRFILNELEEDITPALYDKIKYCITFICTRLNLPIEIIKKCLYIEIAMAECWNVESNQSANLGYILLAEKILME
ncbi:MAG: aminoglycoside resistance protein [Anaerocolumna sp.]|jgi:streptomycin 6-kinase|nr:aminoglycoside resistance protein [Anaerocolumna sp.]